MMKSLPGYFFRADNIFDWIGTGFEVTKQLFLDRPEEDLKYDTILIVRRRYLKSPSNGHCF